MKTIASSLVSNIVVNGKTILPDSLEPRERYSVLRNLLFVCASLLPEYDALLAGWLREMHKYAMQHARTGYETGERCWNAPVISYCCCADCESVGQLAKYLGLQEVEYFVRSQTFCIQEHFGGRSPETRISKKDLEWFDQMVASGRFGPTSMRSIGEEIFSPEKDPLSREPYGWDKATHRPKPSEFEIEILQKFVDRHREFYANLPRAEVEETTLATEVSNNPA
jgi:hypothetical protein